MALVVASFLPRNMLIIVSLLKLHTMHQHTHQPKHLHHTRVDTTREVVTTTKHQLLHLCTLQLRHQFTHQLRLQFTHQLKHQLRLQFTHQLRLQCIHQLRHQSSHQLKLQFSDQLRPQHLMCRFYVRWWLLGVWFTARLASTGG